LSFSPQDEPQFGVEIHIRWPTRGAFKNMNSIMNSRDVRHGNILNAPEPSFRQVPQARLEGDACGSACGGFALGYNTPHAGNQNELRGA
jgi:hypothetical protein